MGILRLLPFLRERDILSKFEGFPVSATVAVDVPIFAYKFSYGQTSYEGFEKMFLDFASDLKKVCLPIFVFDGEKLDLKSDEIERRNIEKLKQLDRIVKKQVEHDEVLNDMGIDIIHEIEQNGIILKIPETKNFHPTKQYYMNLNQTLLSLNYLTRFAKHEAEALCSHLVATGEAWCTITEDTDSLAFGSTRTLFKYTNDPQLVYLPELLAKLELNMDQFVELCCLFGFDFVENVYNIGPAKAYDLMKKNGSLEKIFLLKNQFSEKTAASFDEKSKKWTSAKKLFLSRAGELYEYKII